MNHTLQQLLDEGKITQEEYDILFEDKSSWNIHTNISSSDIWETDDQTFECHHHKWITRDHYYSNALLKVIELQKDNEYIDLTYIQFYKFNFTYFCLVKDMSKTLKFSNAKFYGKASFRSIFHKKVYFNNCIFYDEADFGFTQFKMGASFIKTNFRENAFFNDSAFNNEMYFKGSYFERVADFSNSAFNTLELTNTYINIANFNGIASIEGMDFISIFPNKETARIIKSHYEKNHNIIEANKYFAIEQEMHFKELGWLSNFGTKFTTWLNKNISNYHNSWIRVLMIIIMYTLFVFLGYDYFHQWKTLKSGFYNSLNTAIGLIDPLNMFKEDNNIYEKHQAIGFIIRIITIYLFWQFITAFRQNTRRK